MFETTPQERHDLATVFVPSIERGGAAAEHDRLPRREAERLATHLAGGAHEAVRPPDLLQVPLAGGIVCIARRTVSMSRKHEDIPATQLALGGSNPLVPAVPTVVSKNAVTESKFRAGDLVVHTLRRDRVGRIAELFTEPERVGIWAKVTWLTTGASSEHPETSLEAAK